MPQGSFSDAQPPIGIVPPTSPETLTVLYRTLSELKPYPKNARTHNQRQIRKIADSIQQFGFTNPILLDAHDTIIAGHGRVEAAKLLQLMSVPTIRLESLTPSQVRAYVLADNRLALDAGWSKEILKIELQNLVVENEVDVSIVGFEIGELDLIFGNAPTANDSLDELPLEQPNVVTQLGDLRQLGEHRIFCGDRRSEASFQTLLGERIAAVVFVVPPYNVVIDGHASGNGKIHHAEFRMAAGEMSEDFLLTCLRHLAKWSASGSIHYLAMDWRHMSELLMAGRQVYDKLLNMCVWAKDNGGMGLFYRSQYELIFVYRNGKTQHRNNVQLGRYVRNRSNLWRYPGASALTRKGKEGNLLAMHPTVKPVAMIADALLDSSAPGDIVLDSFLGSGSTLLAAERTRRVCRGIEIEPKYVDCAVRRWETYTGGNAVHVVTGQTFREREKIHG